MAIANLQKLLKSDIEDEKIYALTVIAVEKLKEHIGPVIDLLVLDPLTSIREKAAWALDELNDKEAIPALLNAIHDPAWGVRSNAGWGLVHLGEVIKSDMKDIVETSSSKDAKEMAELVLQRL
ncbi:MAG: HEAT repeat domain-containing protein [Gammaproteobacteria bacterium]|nr:HEAT repeat domain-containing protein [Gammaproteobacteria bacterium]